MNPQNIQTVQVKVTGMSCNGCVRAVENALTRTAGVISSKVSLEEGRAEVQYNPDKVSQDDIVAAIRNAGYGAEITA